MLPFLLAGTGAALLGYMLDDAQDKKIKKKKKKLKKLHKAQAMQHIAQQEKNNNHKRSLLFKEIKDEQTRLKHERKMLITTLKRMPRHAPGYQQLQQEIYYYNDLIEHKQADADMIRF